MAEHLITLPSSTKAVVEHLYHQVHQAPWQARGFQGAHGVSILKAILQRYFCETSMPCGECAPCRQISQNTYPGLHDLSSIPTTGRLGIEVIRSHLEQITQSPSTTRGTFLLITQAMTESAAQALLKSVEEPPPRVAWWICVPHARWLLPTLKSRLSFTRLPRVLPEHASLAMPDEKDFNQHPQEAMNAVEAYCSEHATRAPERIYPLWEAYRKACLARDAGVRWSVLAPALWMIWQSCVTSTD